LKSSSAEEYSGDVYNISTEDETFIINNILTHNCTGRKWGKTTMLVNETFRWLGKPDSIAWWVAPYYNLSQLGLRRFRQAVPPIAIKDYNKKEQMIEMINGSTLWFKSADSENSLVGEGIDFLVIDEAARVKEAVWNEALRPNLSDPRRVGHACMASTPMGHNWFYREWLRGMARGGEYESWGIPVVEIPVTGEKIADTQGGFPSWTNPTFRTKELESALKLPKRVFLQEYGARFLEDLGAVFRGIISARQGEFEPPVRGEEYYMGLDLGKTDDYTVAIIVNTGGHVVAYEKIPKGQSWTQQIHNIINFAREYNEAIITIDATGLGDPVYDFMRVRYPHVNAVKLTQQSKREIVENLAICISTGHFTYPDIPELIEELSLFGAEQTPSGGIRYEAPSGFHDDFVIAAGLACWGNIKAASSKISFEWIDL
jgi:hypothetical protein